MGHLKTSQVWEKLLCLWQVVEVEFSNCPAESFHSELSCWDSIPHLAVDFFCMSQAMQSATSAFESPILG